MKFAKSYQKLESIPIIFLLFSFYSIIDSVGSTNYKLSCLSIDAYRELNLHLRFTLNIALLLNIPLLKSKTEKQKQYPSVVGTMTLVVLI